MKRIACGALALAGLLALGCASTSGDSSQSAPAPRPSQTADQTYSQGTVLREAEAVFGEGAEGIGKLIERSFKESGRPNALIRGEEAGGAFVAGLRYGKGELTFAGGGSRKVYWQSPTIGFDAGGNAAKTFMLVYHLSSAETLYQRFPAVDGSLYFVGGAGLNYNQIGDTKLAVIRLGVGWRAGASVGYVKFTKEATANPF